MKLLSAPAHFTFTDNAGMTFNIDMRKSVLVDYIQNHGVLILKMKIFLGGITIFQGVFFFFFSYKNNVIKTILPDKAKLALQLQ